MKVIKVKSQHEGAQIALTYLKDSLKSGAKTLGLATGSTPLAFYQAIRQSDLDFKGLISINLDEYVGLGAKDSQSYAYFMQEHLFQYKPFGASYLPDGLAQELSSEIVRYDKLIDDYPIDFQILGIGQNGHIGFNEPKTDFNTKTHLVDLSESTIKANSRFFDSIDQVPKQALSMGIASIMKSKRIVLMAYGAQKAQAISSMVEGPVTVDVPASILQTHDDVIVIVDDDAASLLN